MIMDPLISIIVPVYNADRCLSRCIKSILSQNLKNFELLLIDDGSTDKSGKICDEYAAKDKRVKVFHKENGGVSSARNLGLDNARGKWITFIDSDDCIYENIFNLISSHDEDLLIFNYDIDYNGIIQGGESIPHYYNSYPIKTILNKYIYIEILRTPWSKFFKRHLINTLRFDTRIAIGEDSLFVLKYFQRCKSFFLFEQKYYIWSENYSSLKYKYKLSVEQAVYIVTCLYSEYKTLNVRCIQLEKFIYEFYYSLCEDYLYKDCTIWFKNTVIVQIWNNIKFSYSRKRRILFFIKKYRLFSCLLMLYHQKILHN